MYDVIVIGGGPAGLTSALYAARAGKSVLILEKNAFGGQIATAPRVENFPSVKEIAGARLADNMFDQAISHGVEFDMGDAVVDTAESGFTVTTEYASYFTKSVVLAAGVQHKKLPVSSAEQYEGKGVCYCAVCDGAFYKGKTAAVIGGGDTALGDALYLSDLCDKVYLIHRRDQFRGSARTVEQLKQTENVEIITNAVPAKINGSQTVTALELKDGRPVPVNGVFVAVGMKPQTDILRGVVDLDDAGYVVADETCVTSAPGFFAAGDVRKKALRQVVTAVSDGANAAVAAAEYIYGV